jgi:phosphate-selective porin OprO and OprP
MKNTLLLWGFSSVFILTLTSNFAHADEDDISALKRQIQELDQKVRKLEAKRDLDQAEKEKKKADVPKITANSEKGFSISSADDSFYIRFRGLIQTDNRTFFDDGGSIGNDTFLLRRARPIIEGRAFKDFDFLFIPEFGGTTVSILDANLNYRYQPWLQVRGGKFKAPVGLEMLQSDASSFFNERALPTNLVPNRDIGFQVHGDVLDGSLNYAVGIFNGVGDGRSSTNVDLDDEREFAGRIFAFPLKKSKIDQIQGLGIGLGGSAGEEKGTGSNALTGGFLTDGQQTFFTYRTGTGTATSPNIVADGTHWRLTPQAYNYWGPFGLLGEYTISSQELRRDAGTAITRATVDNTAWQIAGSWVITGENASYQGVKPKNEFIPSAGTWGAFELVGRYSELSIDDAAFPLFASSGSANSAHAWGVGLNWYLNRFVRVGLNFFDTEFEGGDESNIVVREDERAFLTRLQLSF